MSKIPRTITRLLPKLSRENKSNMLNSLKHQQDINLKWQRELQEKISDNNKKKVPTNEYIYLIDAWDDARQVNNEIEQDIKEVTKSIRKHDNINKGGKRKKRKTKKSKKNKRKTRRIKGGVLTAAQAAAMQFNVQELERQAVVLEEKLQLIQNGQRAFEISRDPTRMHTPDDIKEIVDDEKKAINRKLTIILNQQAHLVLQLNMNGYNAGI